MGKTSDGRVASYLNDLAEEAVASEPVSVFFANNRDIFEKNTEGVDRAGAFSR
jgi:hypothetical protein